MTQEGKSKHGLFNKVNKSMFNQCKVDKSRFTSKQVDKKWFMIQEGQSKVNFMSVLTHLNGR